MSGLVLDRLFRKLTPAALARVPAARRSERVVGFVFPSNVPDPLAAHVFLALARGQAAYLKLSRRARGFGRALAGSLRAESRLLGDALFATDSKERFWKDASGLDAVVAYGDDGTVAGVRRRLVAGKPFTGRGRAWSAGAVFRSALRPSRIARTAADCARDVWLYDQRGCLSPQVFFVEGADRAPAFAQALAGALGALARRYGRVRRPYDLAFSRRVFLDRLAAAGRGAADADAVVYLAGRGPVAPAGSGQVVAVKAFGGRRELGRELGRFGAGLRGLAVAGSASERRRARRAVRAGVRIAPAGRLQDPPLAWQWGGQSSR
jgi:hypothetical protein